MLNVSGIQSELGLIRHLLAISLALEEVAVSCPYPESGSKSDIMQKLMQIPRSSVKANIIFLDV